MNDDARRYLDCFIAIDKFGDDHAADFAAATPGGVQFALIKTIVNQFQSASAAQVAASGDYSSRVEIKATRREVLRSQMSAISLIARSMEYAFDGISDKFRMPRNRNDADLLAAANAFHSESAANNADFIAYGLPSTFRADLLAAANDFDLSLSETAGAKTDRVEATADIDDWVLQGSRARRILDGIVKIKYAGDKGKLTAWSSASHIEKPPKKKDPTPPTP